MVGAGSDTKATPDMQQAVQERVVFSTLYNESDGYLATYVENFLRHTETDAALVVNLAPGRRIACPIAEASGRVLVFAGGLPRRKYGHTLLNGHLEAYDAALGRFGPFDHFCSLASNSLFARRFNPAAARSALERSELDRGEHDIGLDLDDLPGDWWWSLLPKNPDMIPYMKEIWGLTRAAGNQIEGLFATATDWGLLHARRAQIIEFGETMRPDGEFPMEEILPATFIRTFGSRRYVNLCHMFWDRPFTDNVKMDDVLAIGERFADHICLLKWFERSPINMITAATAKGLAGDLTERLAAVPEADRGQQRVLYRLIFEELARTLRSREGFSSLVSTWRHVDGDQPPARRFEFDQTLQVNRQLIPLPFGPDAPAGEPPAYVITEQTDDQLHLRFDLADAEQTIVTLSSSLAGTGDDDGTVLQGFLYLACCIGPGNRIFRLRILSDDSDHAVRLQDRIVLARGRRYAQQAPAPAAEHDGVREFYYPSEAIPDGDDVWIGLPFFSRSNFRVALDVV